MKFVISTIYGVTERQKYSLGSVKVVSLVSSQIDIILDSHSDTDTPDNIANSICALNPAVIGFGVYIWNYKIIKEVTCKIKKKFPSIIIILGGPIVTKMHNFDLRDFKFSDIFIKGEGELPLKLVLDSLYSSNNVVSEALNSIEGVVTYDFLEIAQTRPWIQDLDKIVASFGNGDLPFHRYSDNANWQFVWWETTRGCVYECGFCDHDNQFKKFRQIPMNVLEKEFCAFINNNVKKIYIVDPIMGGSKKNGADFFKMLASHKHNIAIFGFMRPEFLDNTYIELMIKANIKELQIGIQTTNESVPFWIRKNNYNILKKYLPKLNNTPIKWRADLIVGLPGDTLSGLKNSFKFLFEATNPTTIRAYELSVIPGTPLYDYALNNDSHFVEFKKDDFSVIQAYSYSNDEFNEMMKLANFYCSFYNYGRSKDRKIKEENLFDLYNQLLCGNFGDYNKQLICHQKDNSTNGWAKFETNFAQNYLSLFY